MTTGARERCETCRFSSAVILLRCRRYPPVAVTTLAGFVLPSFLSSYAFPEVRADDWCGEYQPKDQPHD